MLDAYIIEKIKREQERDKLERQPARIERPQPPPEQPNRRYEDSEPDRGVVIIEF